MTRWRIIQGHKPLEAISLVVMDEISGRTAYIEVSAQLLGENFAGRVFHTKNGKSRTLNGAMRAEVLRNAG